MCMYVILMKANYMLDSKHSKTGVKCRSQAELFWHCLENILNICDRWYLNPLLGNLYIFFPFKRNSLIPTWDAVFPSPHSGL